MLRGEQRACLLSWQSACMVRARPWVRVPVRPRFFIFFNSTGVNFVVCFSWCISLIARTQNGQTSVLSFGRSECNTVVLNSSSWSLLSKIY